LETKFQQIGRSGDSVNNDDWFYIPMGDNDGNRAEMQQIMLMGSYEGCIVQAHFYEVGSSWFLQRQVMTVDTIVDATSEAQRVTWNTKKSLSLAFTNEYLIPCDYQKLYYHPFGRFFFYYLNLQKVIILDRGFTTSTGDACTVTETPTAVSTSNSSTISSVQFLTDPAFYDSQYTYIGVDKSNGNSYIFRWNAAMDAAGAVTNNDFTTIHTVAGNIRDLYGMQDVGLFFVLDGSNGYYICKITTSDGTKASVASYETSKSWSIFQAPFNLPTDIRPVYLTDTSEPHKFYKGTNVLTEHFVGTGTQYDFFCYPTRFGRYYAMQIRPGTCAEEGGGSEDYDKLHVNVLSIRDKAHSYCIDDSEDIYCGNGKWEDYNLEECDDGNNSNGDGCSSACVVETRWVCTQVVNATSTCTYTACGNGYLDSAAPYNEECDDGNTDDGDGCSSTCTIEDCYYCSGTGTSNSCTLQCENSVLNSNTYYQGTPKTEVCDEGAAKTDALGCLECCSKIQAEYKCGTPGTECYLR
jgi:cysteine-rich repeat protein